MCASSACVMHFHAFIFTLYVSSVLSENAYRRNSNIKQEINSVMTKKYIQCNDRNLKKKNSPNKIYI